MPRINLLPWREAERKRKRQEFIVGIVGSLILAVLIGLLAQLKWQASIDHQNARNQLIKDKIAEVDKQITEILGLEQQKNRLIARMEVIEQLQRSRPGVVHLFDQLVRTIPDGVYFTSIKQTGTKVQISGIAQSSTRVAALMQNIDKSEYMSNPSVEKVQSKTGSNDGSSVFVLYATQLVQSSDQPNVPARKGTPQRGKRAGVN